MIKTRARLAQQTQFWSNAEVANHEGYVADMHGMLQSVSTLIERNVPADRCRAAWWEVLKASAEYEKIRFDDSRTWMVTRLRDIGGDKPSQDVMLDAVRDQLCE